MKRKTYEVRVGNVGMVYRGHNKLVAEVTLQDYAQKVRRDAARLGPRGRSEFPVVLFVDGEPVQEVER